MVSQIKVPVSVQQNQNNPMLKDSSGDDQSGIQQQQQQQSTKKRKNDQVKHIFRNIEIEKRLIRPISGRRSNEADLKKLRLSFSRSLT